MYGNHRRIVTYKIFITKQLIYANVTIKLALFIYINIPIHRLSSSCAKLASDVGIAVLAILSHKMRTIPLIRCLPKMSPSSSTSTGSQIATWRRSLA